MNTVEELQNLLDAKRAESVRLVMEIENILAQLRPICDHSKDEPYIWESDNGYGRQSRIAGRRCSYCSFVDLWSRGRFINPATITE
jgi:hypothetical protein